MRSVCFDKISKFQVEAVYEEYGLTSHLKVASRFPHCTQLAITGRKIPSDEWENADLRYKPHQTVVTKIAAILRKLKKLFLVGTCFPTDGSDSLRTLLDQFPSCRKISLGGHSTLVRAGAIWRRVAPGEDSLDNPLIASEELESDVKTEPRVTLTLD